MCDNPINHATCNLLNWEFRQFGSELENDSFADKVQGVRGFLLRDVLSRIELLKNLLASNALTPRTQNDIKVYHIIFYVDRFKVALNWAKKIRVKIFHSQCRYRLWRSTD